MRCDLRVACALTVAWPAQNEQNVEHATARDKLRLEADAHAALKKVHKRVEEELGAATEDASALRAELAAVRAESGAEIEELRREVAEMKAAEKR